MLGPSETDCLLPGCFLSACRRRRPPDKRWKPSRWNDWTCNRSRPGKSTLRSPVASSSGRRRRCRRKWLQDDRWLRLHLQIGVRKVETSVNEEKSRDSQMYLFQVRNLISMLKTSVKKVKYFKLNFLFKTNVSQHWYLIIHLKTQEFLVFVV